MNFKVYSITSYNITKNICFYNIINNKLYYYIKILSFYNNQCNLVGFLKKKQMINICIINSLAINSYINIEDENIVEIGAGSGFISIVLSIIRPYITFRLIESKKSKCCFLNKIIILLNLNNVYTQTTRIEKHIYFNKKIIIVCKHFSKFSKFITISKNLSINNNKFITTKCNYKYILKDKLPIKSKIAQIQPVFKKTGKDIFYIIILLF